MGFAEEKMWDYVKENISDFHNVILEDLLNHLLTCLIQPEVEDLQARLCNRGNQRTVFPFLDSLRRRQNWVNKLIMALRRCNHTELADGLQSRYDELQIPNRVVNHSSVPGFPHPLPSATNSHTPSYSSIVPPLQPNNESTGNRAHQPHLASPTVHTASQPVSAGPSHPPQYQRQPPEFDKSSSAMSASSTSSFQTIPCEIYEDLSTPIPESELPMSMTEDNSTNDLTQPLKKAEVESSCHLLSGPALARPDLKPGVPNAEPRRQRETGIHNMGPQVEADGHLDQAAVEVPRCLPPIYDPPSHGIKAASSNVEPSVQRKEEGLQRKETRGEPSDRPMEQLTENFSRQRQHSPTSVSNRNAAGAAPRSQIPRKVMHSFPSREAWDKTSAATMQNRPENYANENVIDENFSKPGVLTSNLDEHDFNQNPAIQPLPGVHELSSIRSSRLVFSNSTEESSSCARRVIQSLAAGDLISGNVQDPVQQQQPDLGLDDPNNRVCTERSDPLMISSSTCSSSSTDSMPYIAKEPEEDHFSFDRSDPGRITGEGRGESHSETTVPVKSLRGLNYMSEKPNKDKSFEGTMSYTFTVTEDATTDNYDANTTITNARSSDTSHSGSTNAQRNDNQAGNNEYAFSHLILPSIVVLLVAASLLQMFRYMRK